MNQSNQFSIELGKAVAQKYADPPQDPLGELSHFELGIRRFCYEHDRQVIWTIGEHKIQVFLDPDICILIEDELPQNISKLEQGGKITLEFCESETVRLTFNPKGNIIECNLKYFGDRVAEENFQLDRNRVIVSLKLFLSQVIIIASDRGYITTEEILEFLQPTLVNCDREFMTA